MLMQLPVSGLTTDKSRRGPAWKGAGGEVALLGKGVGVEVPLDCWDDGKEGGLTGTEILGVGLENIRGVSGTGGKGTGGNTGGATAGD